MDINSALSYLDKNRDRFLGDLKQLIDIPSVSGDPKYHTDVLRCADALIKQMKQAGLQSVSILNEATKNEAPVIYAQLMGNVSAPTVLVYGHYDVVGVDEPNTWSSKPFEASVKDGHIYGRGATDDKGQFLTSVKAFESILKTSGELPLNIKFVFEGEEEGFSDALLKLLSDPSLSEKFKSDVILISDGAWFDADTPSICVGIRGVSEFEVTLKGPTSSIHSGLYGGAVENPASILSKMIGRLWDEDGRITIPGFYDDVAQITQKEREEIAKIPFDEEKFKEEAKTGALGGEKGYSTFERVMLRPAVDVVGIIGGYTGEGPKSIIPSSATAKIGVRIVANQDPEDIANKTKDYLRKICPKGLDLEFKYFGGGHPYRADTSGPQMELAAGVMQEVFGKRPMFIRIGASVPIVANFWQKFKVPIVMCDIGLPTDNVHSDNEHFSIEHFYKGIEMYIRLFDKFAHSSPPL